MSQVEECLPSKKEALGSLSGAKQKRKGKNIINKNTRLGV
jgi:hypothetical protein